MSRRRVFGGRRSTNPFTPPRQGGGLARMLGRVIIAVIVIAAVYLMLDFAGRVWAEAYVASQVEHALSLSGKPDVTFGGPLFLPQLLTGKVTSATAKAEDFTTNNVSFTSATLSLKDVEFSPGKLLFHEDATIVAHSGSGSATMTAKQLTDAFHAQGIPVDVRFQTDGTVRVAASQFPVAVLVSATIEDGALVLRPTNGLLKKFSFKLTLPQLVPGLTYTAIEFDETLGTLRFRLEDATFAVAGSK